MPDRVSTGATKIAVVAGGAEISLQGTYAPPIDGVTNQSAIGLATASANQQYNGTDWDRVRNNVEGTVLASAARTATTSSADFTNHNAKGVRLFINATAASATPSVVFTLEVKDPISSTYTAILTSAAITGTGHTVLVCYPGVTTAANVAVSMALSRTWRVTATAADADSLTYSVGYSYIQ